MSTAESSGLDPAIKAYFDSKFDLLENANATRNAQLAQQISGFTNGIAKLNRRQDILAEENLNLKFEINRLREDFKYIQGKENGNNLVVQNCRVAVDLETEESLVTRVMEIFTAAKIGIERHQITSARRFGEVKPNRIRPIMIRLESPTLKSRIFPAAKFIRDKFQVYINNDYTPSQRQELFNVRSTRRLLGENDVHCQVKGFDLIIDNIPYNWQAARRYLERVLKSRNPSQRTTQSQREDALLLQPHTQLTLPQRGASGAQAASQRTAAHLLMPVDGYSSDSSAGSAVSAKRKARKSPERKSGRFQRKKPGEFHLPSTASSQELPPINSPILASSNEGAMV